MSIALSVIIPCFNEARRIGSTLEATTAYLRGRGLAFELIVVDDGCRDETALVVTSAARELPETRLLQYPWNRGKGYAVRHGVRQARGERVLYMDADLATPIEELPRLERALDDGADVALGSRAVDEADLVVRQPWYREQMGRTFNRMVQLLALPGIRDTQCGFKLIRGAVARELFPRVRSATYTFDVELLMLARAAGYRIDEIGVAWRHVPLSRVHPIIDSSKMAFDLVRLRLRAALGPPRRAG